MTLSHDRRAELLSAARLFDGVDAAGMARLAAVVVEVDFPRDHVIARQGDIGSGLFVITSGGVRVIRDGLQIAELGPGDFFGELSVLDGRPRTAQVVASEPDDLPRPVDLGLRSGRPRGAVGRAGDPARPGGPAARPDRGGTALSRRRRPNAMTGERGGPAGTSTFLFTDIEGSTRLEQRVGTERYGEIRERHRAILRAARSRPTTASSRAPRATRSSWSSRAPVRAWPRPSRPSATSPPKPGRTTRPSASGWESIPARHAWSAAAWSASTSIGPPGSRRWRTVARSWPRTRLVPSSRDRCPTASTLRDLGHHRLRDLGCPNDSPRWTPTACCTTSRRSGRSTRDPNNLPTQLTTFVGRERELAEAGGLLRSTRLLTLTGPGGTGKTRLSLQVAAATADAYPDGVWFVALDAVRDPAMVAPAIARTLGLADDAVRSAVDAVAERIGDDHVLLRAGQLRAGRRRRARRSRTCSAAARTSRRSSPRASRCASRASRNTPSRACRRRPTRATCRRWSA